MTTMLTIYAKNKMLDALTPTSMSLHSAYSATGANEIAGGSPAYARQAVVFMSAASGERQLDRSFPVMFDVPGSTSFGWIGLWDATNTFLGMTPATFGIAPAPFEIGADSVLQVPGLGSYFPNGQTVVVWFLPGANFPSDGAGNLAEGHVYYVVNQTADSVQLALSAGGTPLALSSGLGLLQIINFYSYPLQAVVDFAQLFGMFTITVT